MRRALPLLLVVTLLQGAVVPNRAAEAAMDRNKRMAVMKAVVRLVILVNRGGRMVPVGNGSGTVIRSDGLILTNNHVVQNTKTGRLHDAIAVAVTSSFDKDPKPICLADPRRAIRRPKLDLAMVKCEREVNGAPLRRRIPWSVASVGDSSKIIPGDEMYVVGYPAVGGATITFTAGKVSGFVNDARTGGNRAWVKTDALISPGVSGGAAFDGEGSLVGVPTLLRYRRGGRTNIGLVRPVQKARPLIALVTRKRWGALVRAPAAGGPGPAVAGRIPIPSAGRPGPPPRHGYPPPGYPRPGQPGAPQPGAAGPTPGAPNPSAVPPAGPTPGPGQPPPRGPGVVGVPDVPERGHSGRRPSPGGEVNPARGPSSYVAGQVVDATNHRPIPGAVVMILKPGIKVAQLRRSKLLRQVASVAVATSRGQFATRRPLAHGPSYGIVVTARGYRMLGLDRAVVLMRGTPPMLNLGLVKLQPNGY